VTGSPVMRVAHVSDVYLPQLGGIETFVDSLVRRQRALGTDARVLTWTRAETARGADPDPEFVHRGSRAQLRRLLLSGGFDAVHVHVSLFSPLGMSLASAAIGAGLPIAVTAHSMWPDSVALVRPAGAGLRLAGRPIAWSAVSRPAAVPLRRALGAGVAVDVVTNAVDTAWWATAPEHGPASRTWRQEPAEILVVSLMRMAPRKRPMALLRTLRAAGRLTGETRLRLVCAGDGPQLDRAARAARRWGLAVDLPGRLTPEQSRELLHQADLYIAPADLESFGLAALEARSAGVPVLAKAAGGVGEFVADGVEGRLVADDAELARALAGLATDAGLRRTMAGYNARVGPATTWPVTLDAVRELYARAAAIAGRTLPSYRLHDVGAP
jgi:glycosyltransferase involved in cell wall biosynthesis